jgi:hypothetical protein
MICKKNQITSSKEKVDAFDTQDHFSYTPSTTKEVLIKQ